MNRTRGQNKVKIQNVFNKLKTNLLSGIATRWLISVFGPVLAVVLLSCLIICVFVSNFYTTTVRNKLRAEAENTAKYFESYVYPEYRDFTTCAQLLVSDFDKRGMMEIQVSNLSGKSAYSSTGFAVTELGITPDVPEARSGTASYWSGRLETTGEKIISFSAPLYNTDRRVCGTVRMISSLKNVEELLRSIYLIIGIVGFLIIFLMAFSGIYFIKSIVIPVRQINRVALDIAHGELNANTLNYSANDEIGQLCKNINMMANELADSQKIKNDFISQISHELRTPITAIRGWSETMMADDSLNDLTRRGVGIINDETERLSKMVEEMLDMSRMQSGRLSISVSPVDIIAEFENTVFMMGERAKGESISIVYNMSDDECIVSCDKDRMKQVFFNIIDNSIKHSNPGSEVVVSTQREKNSIKFIVEDFGAGISREDLPYVKEMFYKGSSQKRGSGIGLGVSDEIVRLHGGSLDIESELGIGTKVTVTLPVSEELQNDNTD